MEKIDKIINTVLKKHYRFLQYNFELLDDLRQAIQEVKIISYNKDELYKLISAYFYRFCRENGYHRINNRWTKEVTYGLDPYEYAQENKIKIKILQ